MSHENFSDTKVSLTLGGETYLLTFGITTMRRIEEVHKNFSLLDGVLPPFEVLPFLIQSAIPDEKRKWKDEAEFIEIYDNCRDEENLQKVLLAYQNAVGFIDRRFVPVVGRLTEAIAEMQKLDQEYEQKKKRKQK